MKMSFQHFGQGNKLKKKFCENDCIIHYKMCGGMSKYKQKLNIEI